MSDSPKSTSTAQILAIGSAQTIAWASSAYLPAVVGIPMARDHGVSSATVYAAYSGALIVMAMLGPAVGRAIDQRGGRGVLSLSNAILAAGLVALALSPGVVAMIVAWAVLGIGMALGLYDAAFAALVRQHGMQARRPITGITLLAGFASTVGWPITSAMVAAWDWRVACGLWALMHLAIALPLNWFWLPPVSDPAAPAAAPAPSQHMTDRHQSRRLFWLLAIFGATTAFVTSAMAAHLPGLLQAIGLGAGAAVAASALVGPAQVVARVLEFMAGTRLRIHPLVTARVAGALHPIGGLVLLCAAGPWGAGLFALLHGAGNGLLTIAKGTLPLAVFGVQGYGARQGLLAIAQRGLQAAAPLLVALVLERWGAWTVLFMTGAMSALAIVALAGIAKPRD